MAARNIYDLNDDCLFLIFKFLDINQLMDLCVTTKRFRKIVVDHVVPRYLVNVAGPKVDYTMNELFQVFGKTMRKVKFDAKKVINEGRTRGLAGSIFEVLLQMLLDYCEPGMLNEVWIVKVNEKIQNRPISPDFLEKCATYFKNVTNLEIEFSCNDNCTIPMEEWLASIPDQQIQKFSLGLRHADGYNFKLSPISFPNLERFELYSLDGKASTDFGGFTEFIVNKSHLKLFIVYGFTVTNVLLRTVANEIPNCRSFGYIDLDSNPGEINLEQLKNLKTIYVEGSPINCLVETDKIFKTLDSTVTLNRMVIHINKSVRDDNICRTVLWLVEANAQRKKIVLERLDITIRWIWNSDNMHMFFNYLFGIMFTVKTLHLTGPIKNIGIITTAVRTLSCLEHVFIIFEELIENDDVVDTWSESYKHLLLEKVIANKKMGTSKRLIICVEGGIADKCIVKLGSDYEHKVIALGSTSQYNFNYWSYS